MIYPANKDFPFDQLTLVPSAIVNGSFFTKYLINEKPLYIETPKCFSKNGIVKTGKRMFCDLIFIRENEQFIQWIEHLETFTQKYIYDNREKWFETPLEMTDIEDSFTQITKSYKSGKNYLIRTNIPVKPAAATAAATATSTTVCSLKIYDENENNVDPDSITDKTEIKTILEIQGVKCSSKNFQVELEMKQMMVFNSNDPFEKCVFKTSTQTIATSPPIVQQDILERPPKAEKINLYDTPPVAVQASEPPKPNVVSPASVPAPADAPTHTQISSTNAPSAESELCEIEFDLEELPESETVQLKNRNDVYYEKYREAKRKAKIARDLALSSYLEAKRIKNTYMLDDIEDSDDDFYKDGDDSEDDDEEYYDEGDEYEVDDPHSENAEKKNKIVVQEEDPSDP
jgi:hypothetical protein